MAKLKALAASNLPLAGMRPAPKVAFGSFTPVHRIQKLAVDSKSLWRQKPHGVCLRAPGFRGMAEPRGPAGLTDSWYCMSEVHTSSSPTTHGMASVWSFSSFRAWGEDRRQREPFLPSCCPRNPEAGSAKQPRREGGARAETCPPDRPPPRHLLACKKPRPVLPAGPIREEILETASEIYMKSHNFKTLAVRRRNFFGCAV